MRQRDIVVVILILLVEVVILSLANQTLLRWGSGLFLILNTGGFLAIFSKKVKNREELWDENADKAEPRLDATVRIAHEALQYMRRGLNEASATKIAEIIQDTAEVAAVAITDKEKVLAFLGVGCEKHQPGDQILTEVTRGVIATGEYKVVRSQYQLNCARRDNCNCPLSVAVVVPLKCREETVGTVKLYETRDGQMHPSTIRLALGMAQILSMQIELAELDRQAQLVTKAELDALQAQINPHFFFNTLNTIIMYSRTNPNRARRLLIRLSEFFRQALKQRGNFLSLQEELDFVNTYMVLEKARFGPKLRVIQDIQPDLSVEMIPRLTLQPLVENAVKHGITPKLGPGAIKISAQREGTELVIVVKDDGVGISPEKLGMVLQPGFGSGNGVGLSNVHERLKGLFGENYGLKIQSTPNVGTTITMRIPLRTGAPGLSEKN
ncbi:MAG TPA: histidine kinase [Verrucomicrobiae bacterium]|nr:histidine kinase [Verrucomicrobiae bacterium]